ncbi:hypothetical protein Pfo_031539 [Paulownia fortunei]|nr:hypothetical protein Pfo_031539 [Paulownia fortunei]
MAIYDPTKTPADSYDTHTHLNDDKLYHDVDAYIGRANEFRVMEMNIVGYDAVANQRALSIAQSHENVYAVLGFQPEDTDGFDETAATTLAEQLQQDKVVGVGETRIRNIITKAIPTAKQAYITQDQARASHDNPHKSLGIEHASPDTIINALRHLMTPRVTVSSDIDQSFLLQQGLLSGPNARERRAVVGEKLHVGYTNGKQLIKRLNAFGIKRTQVEEALKGQMQTSEIKAEDHVIEIGPGIGALTEQLAKSAKKVVAFEIDPQMVAVLSDTLSPYQNIHVIENDILKVNLKQVITEEFGENANVKIVANLPYYITTPILMQLLRADIAWDNIVVMMQREVADRLNAQVGTKEYGVLTLTIQYFATAQLAIKVPATSFNPAPNVDSAVVKLTPLTPDVSVEQPNQLFGVIKGTFSHRRKSLWNNLLQTYGKEAEIKSKLEKALQEANIEPSIRAERLD